MAGEARPGEAWQAWQGWARLGRDKLGIARLSRYTFRATSSKAEQGTHNSLVLGSNPRWPIWQARRGAAGPAGQGTAWQG